MHTTTSTFKFQPAQELQLQSLQVDALSCIQGAQGRVADMLLRAGANERLVRMARSDLLETLLARAAACIAASAGCPRRSNSPLRERYLSVHLELTLATWLKTNAQDAGEAAAAQRCLQALRERIA